VAGSSGAIRRPAGSNIVPSLPNNVVLHHRWSHMGGVAQWEGLRLLQVWRCMEVLAWVGACVRVGYTE